MKNKIIFEKLNEEDISEIIIEYLQKKHNNSSYGKILFMGEAGKDLRCVCAVSDEIPKNDLNLAEADKNMGFTGDHEFLKNNPDFLL